MAGIVLTIGSTSMYNHKKLHDTFLYSQFIESSIQKITPYYCLSKFKRINQEDQNYLVNDNLSIYCVGNIAYNDLMGKKAIQSIYEAFKKRKLLEIVSNIDGHFILVLINHNENRINIITDHGGIIHTYKHFDGKNFYFTTSSLVLSRNINVTLDADGVAQFLRCDSICDCDTIYKEIKLLEPGCIYQYEMREEIVKERKYVYWKSPTFVEERMDLEEAAELWTKALIDTCKKIPKNKIICDLTGGFDTRSILSILLKLEDLKLEDLSTFVFGPEHSNEVQIAKEICSKLNLSMMHTQLPDSWAKEYCEYVKESILLTDGEENACKYALIKYANQKKSEKYLFSINGLGGPVVKSFNWIQEFDIKKKPANISRFINMRALKSEFNCEVFKKKWRDKIVSIRKILNDKYLSIISDMDKNMTFNTLQLDNIDFRQRERRWGGRTISSSNRIINVISPLYFKKCIEVGMVIPPRFKKNKRLLRKVIQSANPQLGGQRMLDGTPCEVINVKNFYKFTPLLNNILKKAIKIGFKKVFKQNIFSAQSTEYPRFNWYKEMFSQKNMDIYDIENWVTEPLYVQNKLKEFIERTNEPGFKYYTQLEKMITLELRVREDKVKI